MRASVDGTCGGLTAFSTVPPYARLKALASGPSENQTVDIAASELYALEYVDDYTFEYVSVYDTSTLKRVARIGPFPYGASPYGVAVDSSGRRLFVLFPQSKLSPADSAVQVYGIESGQTYSLLRSFTAGSDYMTVAPYGP